MKKVILSILMLLLVSALVSCSQPSNTDTKTMIVNQKEVSFNQNVIDLVEHRESPTVKYAIGPDMKPDYIIEVNNEVYQIYQVSKNAIVSLKSENENYLYELSERKYNKLVKVLK